MDEYMENGGRVGMTKEEITNAYTYAYNLLQKTEANIESTANKPNHTDEEMSGLEFKRDCIHTICYALSLYMDE